MSENDITNSIGQRLQRKREACGVTQDEIATVANCSTNHISKLERNLHSMTVDVLLAYCKKLQQTPNQILDFDKADNIEFELKEAIVRLDHEQQMKILDVINTFYPVQNNSN